ncbi:MAG: cytochrome c oxidase assembly protein [Pikeienuella sp.]|uniref:cytochrome c oxidase assembly protein n=1 Tax=Pikeienuella sp. TaxID=2831957 RepID=UPI00391C973C
MTGSVRNRKTMFGLAGLGVFMLGMSFAAVPLYDLFCRVTGYGGTTSVSDTAPDVILDREVTVRFAASVERGMPWSFRPVETSMTVRIGETGLAFYEATNPTDRPVAGTASFNVTPFSAGGHFTKIACFCFTEQVLQPGESVKMPVTFYVDPSIMEDEEAALVHTITLSYTFHETDMPEAAAAPQAVDAPDPAG